MTYLKVVLAVICVHFCFPGAASASDREARGTPGDFDYYVLALSWSPTFCSDGDNRSSPQCRAARPYSFIVHGLWPQYKSGYPQYCASPGRLSRSVISEIRDLIPSEGLIRHQWEKHGVCSGLSAGDYFALTRLLFESLTLPKRFTDPVRTSTMAPGSVAQSFSSTTDLLDRDELVVTCRRQKLREVRICFDKNTWEPRPCTSSVNRSRCRRDEIVIPPVR